MKDFREVVKLKKIPASFQFRCTLCQYETNNADWHLGLIEMNKHVISRHSAEAESLDMEELYSRKPTISLESF